MKKAQLRQELAQVRAENQRLKTIIKWIAEMVKDGIILGVGLWLGS